MKRFWSKVYKESGVYGASGTFPTQCWIWQAHIADGYGKFTVCYNGIAKKVRAHRFAYELTYGTVARNISVCHECDNRKCVRPDHLFLGTNSDNVSDRDAKGRQARGISHGLAILKELDVKQIRVLYKKGWTQQKLAKRFVVCQSLISDIVNYKRWKYLV